jgi:hypothetical protein
MNDPLERFARAAERARREQLPATDSVAPEVLRRLRIAQAPLDRPLWWVAAGSLVAALLTMAMNYNYLLDSPDTFNELAVYAGWIML